MLVDLLLLEELVPLLLGIDVFEDCPWLLGNDVLLVGVAEGRAAVGTGGEVLFGAGTLAEEAELVGAAVDVAPVPGTGVITTLPFTDLMSTWC